jgi:sulfite exporter TauE/SafE
MNSGIPDANRTTMNPEIIVLSLSAATLAFVHTLLGPDHYLPLAAMSRARGWSVAKTLKVTLLCGTGHLAGSVILGALGILVGLQVASLEWLENVRGQLVAWVLIGFGLAYTAWGLRRALLNRTHSHWHSHGGVTHCHTHHHKEGHAHLHDAAGKEGKLTPWVIFTVFVVGPCEPLIPLLMYPAATQSPLGVASVTIMFGLVTVFTMLLAVYIAVMGLNKLRLRSLEPYVNAVAGIAVLACGLGIAFMGL